MSYHRRGKKVKATRYTGPDSVADVMQRFPGMAPDDYGDLLVVMDDQGHTVATLRLGDWVVEDGADTRVLTPEQFEATHYRRGK